MIIINIHQYVFSIPCRLYKDQGIYSWIENKHHKLNKILYIDYNTWEEDLTLDYLVFVPGQIYFTHIMVHMYHMI